MDEAKVRESLESLKSQVAELEMLLTPEVETAASESVEGPLYGIDPCKVGLHLLKDKWRQKSFIKHHCDQLLDAERLQRTIEVTRICAPQRTVQQGFLISDSLRTPKDKITKGTERWLEAQIFDLYELANPNLPPCPLWKGICARQVPLFDKAAKGGWGEVDLIAVGNEGHPTVVELKLHKVGAEPPQRPLFEGVAYSIALSKCWNSFWPEWDAVLQGIDFNGEKVNESKQVDVVLLAPDSYWDYWLNQRQYRDAKLSYRTLIGRFADHGVRVQIAGVTMTDGNPSEVHGRDDFLE